MKTKIYDYNWKIIQKIHDETGSLKIIQEKYNTLNYINNMIFLKYNIYFFIKHAIYII